MHGVSLFSTRRIPVCGSAGTFQSVSRQWINTGNRCRPCHVLHRPLVPLKDSAVFKRGLKLHERRDLLVRHAILGVGAPEAALVVVVALVVFGPKGLAEAARSAAKMVKSFSPAIRELAEVSTDLKSTFQQEIGLEQIQRDLREAVDPNILTQQARRLTDDEVTEMDPDIEAKREAAAKMAWGTDTVPTVTSSSDEAGNAREDIDPSLEMISANPMVLKNLTTEQLEDELMKRRKMQHDSEINE